MLAVFSLLVFLSACKNQEEKMAQVENEVVEGEHARPMINDNGEPWSTQQLMEPKDLAHLLENSQETPLIYSLGAGGIIPGSKDTGPSGEKESLERLRTELQDLPRDTEIVIYCGCCPFNICPNVRPAFSLLNEMDFTNHKLLNLRENVKVDWIDKGYPVGN